MPSGPSARWSHLLALVGFVGLCLLVGASGAALTRGGMAAWYPALAKPPGTPPDWVFPLAWTALYVLMGVAAWLVWCRPGHGGALQLWGWQLLANAVWTPVFFGLRNPAWGLAVILVLVVLIGLTLWRFRRIRPLAAGLLVPYLAWACYAAYLNAGIVVLNRAA